jgi:tetratricopeptide (TPR) repeat protein
VWSLPVFQKHYFAFISYSHSDKKWATWLHRKLESYKTPRQIMGKAAYGGAIPARLSPVFRDREDLPSSSNLSASVIGALKRSSNLIVICSPRSAQSRWVNEEILSFKKLNDAARIFCLIVDGEPNSPDKELECFPKALRVQFDADGGQLPELSEPVAADVRPEGDGRQLARLKLIAGLIGVELDDLRQREARRRHQHLAAITAASLAGMVMTLMLAFAAYEARDEARQRREQAEDLISFMLGDLRERLHDVGRLDILDSVANKALDYFDELPPEQLDNEALARRAVALRQLGQVQLDRGELDAAMKLFEESLTASEALGMRDEENLVRQYELGQAHFWVGYVHWQIGDLAAAEDALQIYYAISGKLAAAEPTNEGYELELGYAFQTLASLSARRGNLDAAFNFGRQHIQISRAIFERDRSNETSRKSLAYAYSLNGTMLRKTGKLNESRELFSNYLELADEASRHDPEDTQWLEDRMIAHHFIARVSLDLGDVQQSAEHYEGASKIADLLIGIEPKNDFWQRERIKLLIAFSEEKAMKGDRIGALDALDAARSWVDERLTRDAENLAWLQIKATVELTAGRSYLEIAELGQALLAAQQALERARNLAREDAESTSIRSLLAKCLILAGRIHAALDSQEQAQAAWTEALEILGSDAFTSSNAALLDPLVRTSIYLGKLEVALPLIDRLHTSGYRHPEFFAACYEARIDC